MTVTVLLEGDEVCWKMASPFAYSAPGVQPSKRMLNSLGLIAIAIIIIIIVIVITIMNRQYLLHTY